MPPPHIDPKAFFGLNTEVKSNAHFITDTELIYPAGGVIVLHDYATKQQRYIKLPDKHRPIHSISISPNKKYVVVSEKTDPKHQRPTLSIFNIETLEKIKGLIIPFDEITAKEFIAVQFTWDSKYLVAITGEPDWMLYYYNWECGKIESYIKAQNPNGNGFVTQVNCNPADSALVVLTGPQTFRLMNVSETVWRQWGWAKAENYIITSAMWMTPDRVMFGTKNGMLHIVENGEIKQAFSYNALQIQEINMSKIDEKTDSIDGNKPDQFDTKLSTENLEVCCLTMFSKGFAYSMLSGHVHMFEKNSTNKWTKRNVFQITDEKFRLSEEKVIDLNIIQHITVNPCEDMLVVTTLKSQLYSVKLFEKNIQQMPIIPFTNVGQALHHGYINAVSVCAWKPIFLTSGQDDKTVRLWNYESQELELVKYYQEDIFSLCLHPTGLFAVIGFSDKLKYMVVLIDDLLQVRDFPIRNCKVCRFSNNGHLFAAVNESMIQIFSSVSFNNVYTLKGHNSLVQGLSWSAGDEKLVSCGSDGAVYEWCMLTSNRVGEVILKNSNFLDCSVKSDGKSTYIVGVDGEVKEVLNNMVVRNLKIIGCQLDNIILARSDLMLFVTGGKGNVISIQFPLLDKAVFEEFHMHNANVTAMSLSYDDQTLITVAEDATICIWKLDNSDGKAIVMDSGFSYSKEILINKDDLHDKIADIQVLSTRILELETEHAYQIRTLKTNNIDTLNDIEIKYKNIIKTYEETIEDMKTKHLYEVSTINEENDQVKIKYEKELEEMETNFNEKLIFEYEKYKALENQIEHMKKSHDDNKRELLEAKKLALEELKEMYELQIEESTKNIDELNDKLHNEMLEHEYIKNAIEDDADMEIIDIKEKYETQLKECKDGNIKLKGEIGVLKRKIIAAHNEIDEYKEKLQKSKENEEKLQEIIENLREDIGDLKKEILERELAIQLKEKTVQKLNVKNQELEKYKFVLSFKIEELKDQIEPKNKEIEELHQHIIKVENDISELNEQKSNLEFKMTVMKQKLEGSNASISKEVQNNVKLGQEMKKLYYEIMNLSDFIQEPSKLKTSVKNLIQSKIKITEQIKDDLQEENKKLQGFLHEKQVLENRINVLNNQLSNKQTAVKLINIKMMKENNFLIEENQKLRKELREKSSECTELKGLLSHSNKKQTVINLKKGKKNNA